jgi:hypothetical protein
VALSIFASSLRLGALVTACVALTGCTPKEEKYESVCQLIRREIVTEDDKGPTVVDVELEWDPCPGDQFQVVRGGREFAACIQKYKIGDFVPVQVVHAWDSRGYYSWDLSKVGDCKHDIDWEAEGSYEKSQECSEDKEHGEVSGFKCSRRPVKSLLKVCPWTARN